MALFAALTLGSSHIVIAQDCSIGSGSIVVSLDQADTGSATYTWSVTNNDNGVGNRLTKVTFETGSGVWTNTSTTVANWTVATEVVNPGTPDEWTALAFSWVDEQSNTRIFGGASETFTYTLTPFIANAQIGTIQGNGQAESFLFEDMDIGASCSSLAVEVTDLQASAIAGAVVVEWTVASDQNVASYEVQADFGFGFETVGDVASNPGLGGRYDYSIAIGEATARSVKVRLAIIDFDGSVSFSREVEVFATDALRSDILDVYPNPIADAFTVTFAVKAAQQVNVVLVDLLGRQVANVFSAPVSENASVSVAVDTDTLPTGIYMLSVRGERFSTTRAVSIVK